MPNASIQCQCRKYFVLYVPRQGKDVEVGVGNRYMATSSHYSAVYIIKTHIFHNVDQAFFKSFSVRHTHHSVFFRKINS